MSNLNWCFDVAAGLLLIGFIIQGIRKGFSKLIIPFVLNLVFVIVAFFMSGVLAETIFDSTVEDSVRLSVEETIDNFDIYAVLCREYSELTLIDQVSEKEAGSVLGSEKEMDSKFWELIDSTSGVGDKVNESECFNALNNIIKTTLHESISENIPPCAGKYFEELDESNKDETFKILNMIYTDRHQAADYITDNYISDVMFRFVQMLIFFVSSMVLMIITNILISVVFRNKDMTSNGKGDSAAGVLIEILNGIMIIAVVAVLVKILVYSGIKIDGIMDDQTLGNSYVFKYLYGIDRFLPGNRM